MRQRAILLALAAVVAVSLGIVRSSGLPRATAAVEPPSPSTEPLSGRVATAPDGSTAREITLYATDGTLIAPDGQRLYIWGYSDQNRPGTATLPGPLLRVKEGEQVRLILVNLGPSLEKGVQARHTIHLHGLDVDTANDGVPHTSADLGVGDSFTYSFTAPHAGTYWYHCHVDTVEHLQMGMYGALVVMPADNTRRAWSGGPVYDREVTMVLSEVDPVWHKAVHSRQAYDKSDYRPKYHLINGKAFPEVAVDPKSIITGEVGDHVLVRLLNTGYTWKSMHLHGFHFQVIASDGRPLQAPLNKDTLSLAPGERYDILVHLDKKGAYPFHSHVILDNLNNGAYPGGLHTMVYAGVPVTQDHDHASHGAPAAPSPGPITATAPDKPQAAEAPEPTLETVHLQTGAKEAHVGDRTLPLEVPPAAEEGDLLVAMSGPRDLLGAEMAWDGSAQAVTYTYGQRTVKLWLDKSSAEVNGKIQRAPTAPRMKDGKLLVPLLFVSQGLGMSPRFDSGSGQAVIPLPPVVTVSVKNNLYQPANLRIKAGTVVLWRNAETTQHTVGSDLWPNATLGPGGTFRYRFETPGTYEYVCDLHASMVGRVIVE